MPYSELNITTKPEHIELLMGLLSQFPFDSFVENEVGFQAYIDQSDLKKLLTDTDFEHIRETIPFQYETSDVEEKNWNKEWEKNFDPIMVGKKCQIRAEFHTASSDIDQEVIINPKMAFGTGHHATTYMMTEALFDLKLKEKSVLDMGCGTGVLAILAKKLGANKVYAIDIDHWAVENTLENCSLNNMSGIEILEGDAKILTDLPIFDVVLANINRNILLGDIKQYLRKLKPGGDLLLSGFYMEDNYHFIKRAKDWNLSLVNSNNMENWSMLHFTKK